MKYKYIHFVKVERKAKTSVWECRNNRSGSVLGIVKWYSQWREYCYFPYECSLYNDSCLNDIANFLNKITRAHKKGNPQLHEAVK